MAQSQTNTTVSVNGNTGGTVQTTAPYKCATHTTTTVFFKKGEKFTNCPSSGSSGHSTTWTTGVSQPAEQ